MKNVKITVPRNIIKKFYPHPEPLGDGAYVVDLINDMYTDVFYSEKYEFITITNDIDLIHYLNHERVLKREYVFQHDQYALRKVTNQDYQLLRDWQTLTPNTLKSHQVLHFDKEIKYIFCYYHIEIGLITFDSIKRRLIFKTYNKKFISQKNLVEAFIWMIHVLT